VVIGEGDNVINEILSEQSIDDVKGLFFKNKISNKIVYTGNRSLIENINLLPFPNWKLFDLSKYKNSRLSSRQNPVGHIETSRGCSFHCNFCNKLTFGTVYREKKPKRVVDEMEYMLSCGFKEIHIADDSFTQNIQRAKEICKEISKKPEFIIVPFDGIIAGLKQKKYDAIISAMTITDERSKEVGFSKPYFLAGQSIVVREDNNSIKSLNDLINKKIGVQLGTTGEIEAKKILNVVVVSYDNISAAFIDLKNGRIDAIINDIPTNRLIVNQKGKMKIVGEPLTKECYGIAVRQEDKKLLELINCTLDKIQKNGIQRKLYRKWQIE